MKKNYKMILFDSFLLIKLIYNYKKEETCIFRYKIFNMRVKCTCLIFLYVFILNAQSYQDYSIEEIKIKNKNQAFHTQNDIMFDNEGVIWYSIHNTLVQDFRNNHIFHELLNNQSNERIDIKDFLQRKDSIIYATSEKGLYVLNPITGHKKLEREYLNGNLIIPQDLSLDSNDNVWITTNEKLILKYNSEGKVNKYDIDYDGIFKKQSKFRRILFFKDKVLFVDKNDIYLLNEKQQFSLIYKSTQKNTQATLILLENGSFFNRDTSGNLKIDTEDSNYTFSSLLNAQMIMIPGRSAINVSEENIFVNNYKIDFISKIDNKMLFYHWSKNEKKLKKINTIDFKGLINSFVVNKNYLLIATIGKLHLLTFNKYRFLNYLKSPKKVITTRSIRMSTKEDIYVIENNSVLELKKNKPPKVIYTNNSDDYFLWNLTLENDSILWFSGLENELHKYNIITQKSKKYEIPFIEKNSFCLYQSTCEYSENEMLLGGSFGLVKFNKLSEAFERYDAEFDIQKYFIKDVIYKNNILWVATQDNGLFYFNEKTKEQRHYKSSERYYKLTGNKLYDIHLSKDDEIWIGSTNGVDVLEPNTNKITHYDINDGLPDKRVVSIIETEEDFWMGTFNGLVRFNKVVKEMSTYDGSNGLNVSEFNQKSFYHFNDSLVFFGGINGFTMFNPNKIKRKQVNSKIKLIKTLFYDKDIDSLSSKKYNISHIDEIDVPYKNNYISLTFGNLYSNNDKILYKIPNLYSDWFLANDNGEVNLVSLPEGKHTLVLKPLNNSKSSTYNSLKYIISVKKAFYEKNWILTLFVSLVLILGITSYSIYKKKIAKEKSYTYKIRQLHDKAYKAQMNPHFTYNAINNIQSAFILKGEHFVNKYLTSFAKVLRVTLRNSDLEKITLKEEIEYLKAYSTLFELSDSDIYTFFDIDDELDTNLIEIPPMLFQPLIENAMIHGLKNKKGEKILTIIFKRFENHLLGIIKDNGIGISQSKKESKKKYKSYGNKILHDRIKIYNDMYSSKKIELKVESLKNNTGTKVVLLIPI